MRNAKSSTIFYVVSKITETLSVDSFDFLNRIWMEKGITKESLTRINVKFDAEDVKNKRSIDFMR